MRLTIMVSIVIAAILTVGCQRKEKLPKPVMSMAPFVFCPDYSA